MKSNGTTIDQLVSASNNNAVSPSALKVAAAALAKEQQERDERNALSYLRSVDEYIGGRVTRLRSAREVERQEKDRLEKALAAKEAFLKSGDFETFRKTVNVL